MITLLFEASLAIFLLGVGPDLASAVAHYSTLIGLKRWIACSAVPIRSNHERFTETQCTCQKKYLVIRVQYAQTICWQKLFRNKSYL